MILQCEGAHGFALVHGLLRRYGFSVGTHRLRTNPHPKVLAVGLPQACPGANGELSQLPGSKVSLAPAPGSPRRFGGRRLRTGEDPRYLGAIEGPGPLGGMRSRRWGRAAPTAG